MSGFLICVLSTFLLAGISYARSQPPEARAKMLIQELAANEFDKVESVFDQKMNVALPKDKLAMVWDRITGQAGRLRSVGDAKVHIQGHLHIVDVPCQFERAELDVKVVFDAEGRIAGLFFAPASSKTTWSSPSYADPNRFHEQVTTVVDGTWRLPGTLILPNGPGPFAGIVLVQGSGPEDQDETIGPNKPFKDLAWGLATDGIAVLRYNKRTYEYPREIAEHEKEFTVNDETVDDARAAIALLAAQPYVSRRCVFLLGHSLGGTLAPRTAQGDPRVAGLIIMAGATRPLAQVVVDQLKYLTALHSSNTQENSRQLQAAEAAEREIDSPNLRPSETVDLLGASIPASYFLDLRHYNPEETAARLNIPILILQGERDYQVTTNDLMSWKHALAGDQLAKFKVYPDLNHLFMVSTSPGTGPATPADYLHSGHLRQIVIDDIANWVAARERSM